MKDVVQTTKNVNDSSQVDNGKYSLLIVEDEVDLLETLADALRDEGYRVDSDADPQQALHKIALQNYDVVITDLMMPEVTGMDIIDIIRKNGHDTQIIIITSFPTLDTAVKSIHRGVFSYIIKPFGYKELIDLVHRAIEKLKMQRKLADYQKQDSSSLPKLKIICDIMTILNQVKDFNLTAEIILDTCSEYFKFPISGLLVFDENKQSYNMVKSRNLPVPMAGQFKLRLMQKINDQSILKDQPGLFQLHEGSISLDGETFPIDKSMNSLLLLPINFHEQLRGFLFLLSGVQAGLMPMEDLSLLSSFSTQIAPILSSFENVKRTDRSFENIISKIIRDRIHEARLSLSPISFAIFRVVFTDNYSDSLILNDVVKTYQANFYKELGKHADLIWLTLDTALVVFTKADLFTAESLCARLKDNAVSYSKDSDQNLTFILKYVCLSYPQSGKDDSEVINNLWLKLLEELSGRSN